MYSFYSLLQVHTYERGPFLVGSLGLSCRYKRFLFCLGCFSVGPIQNILFPTRTLFQFKCPIAQQPGQAVVQGRRLWMCVSVPDLMLWQMLGPLARTLYQCLIVLYSTCIMYISDCDTFIKEGGGGSHCRLYPRWKRGNRLRRHQKLWDSSINILPLWAFPEFCHFEDVHCKKTVSHFSVPSRDVTIQTFMAGNN